MNWFEEKYHLLHKDTLLIKPLTNNHNLIIETYNLLYLYYYIVIRCIKMWILYTYQDTGYTKKTPGLWPGFLLHSF